MAVRCLIIGWDAADSETVEQMLNAGELPVLQSLRQRGSAGAIEPLPGLGDDGHWATFSTGVPPGEHGRFHHLQAAPNSYETVPFRRRHMTAPPFWEAFAARGHRVAVLDVPKSPLADTPGCRQVADWMVHGADAGGPSGTPPDVVDRVAHLSPELRCFDCYRTFSGVAEIEEVFRMITSRLQARTRVLTEWCGEQDWDLLMAVFAESHCAGHHAWHVHDPLHPEHFRLPSGVDPVRATYLELDRALGQLVEAAGAEVATVVFSLIGMGGTNGSGTDLLDEILLRLQPDSAASRGLYPAAALARRHASRRLRAVLPPLVKSSLRKAAAPQARRRAFAVPHDAVSGAIRLNVKGREPYGLVAPGSEYDRLCDELAEEMRRLVHPDTKRRLVSDVVRVRSRYPGPRADVFADLLVVWDQQAPISAAFSERVGVVRVSSSLYRTGNHRPGGWFVVNRPQLATPPVRVVDLAPLIASIVAG